MPRIQRFHWSALGPHLHGRHSGSLFVAWPSPVDHDACLAEAGFTDFADTDDVWDREFVAGLERCIGSFSGCGAPEVTGCDPPSSRVPKAGPWLAPAERLALAAREDHFGPCSVSFGDTAIMLTSDGHPLVWVWLVESAAGPWREHLDALRGGAAGERGEIDWRRLGVPADFTRA